MFIQKNLTTAKKLRSILLLRKRWFFIASKAILLFSLLAVLITSLYIYAVRQNPYNLFGPLLSLKAIENPELDLSSEVISADGVLIGRYCHENRSLVTYDKL